jgi:Ca2+-binding RTX toxin-like protein
LHVKNAPLQLSFGASFLNFFDSLVRPRHRNKESVMISLFRQLLGLGGTTRGKQGLSQSERWRRHLQVEELMPRALPSGGTVTLSSSGLLSIIGTPHNDTATVSVSTYNPSRLKVVLDGTTHTFNRSAVKSIFFDGKAGNDTFINNTSISSVAYGGVGNDKLIGGSGKDILLGGLGNDTIVGRSGNDYIDGGLGDDTDNGGAGDDIVNDDNGNDNEMNGEENDQGNTCEASLSNSTTGATGQAEFNSTTKEFELEVQGAPANSTLNVSINGTVVTTITTDANGKGELEIDQATFTVPDQATITVGDPSNGGLTGTFQCGNNNDQGQSELVAALTNSVSSMRGSAQFDPSEQKLEVEVEGLAANTTYNVAIDGVVVSTITTDSEGEGEMQLVSSSLVVNDGSAITIGDPMAPVLQGTFAKSSEDQQ